MNQADARWLESYINEHDMYHFAEAKSDGQDALPFARGEWYVVSHLIGQEDDADIYDSLTAYVSDMIHYKGSFLTRGSLAHLKQEFEAHVKKEQSCEQFLAAA